MLVDVIILDLILWRIVWLKMPISDFDRYMSLHVVLLLNFGLWTFNVINEYISKPFRSISISCNIHLESVTR